MKFWVEHTSHYDGYLTQNGLKQKQNLSINNVRKKIFAKIKHKHLL